MEKNKNVNDYDLNNFDIEARTLRAKKYLREHETAREDEEMEKRKFWFLLDAVTVIGIMLLLVLFFACVY